MKKKTHIFFEVQNKFKKLELFIVMLNLQNLHKKIKKSIITKAF